MGFSSNGICSTGAIFTDIYVCTPRIFLRSIARSTFTTIELSRGKARKHGQKQTVDGYEHLGITLIRFCLPIPPPKLMMRNTQAFKRVYLMNHSVHELDFDDGDYNHRQYALCTTRTSRKTKPNESMPIYLPAWKGARPSRKTFFIQGYYRTRDFLTYENPLRIPMYSGHCTPTSKYAKKKYGPSGWGCHKSFCGIIIRLKPCCWCDETQELQPPTRIPFTNISID